MATSIIKSERQLINNYISANSSVSLRLENNRSYFVICHTAGICAIGIARVSGNGTTNYIPVHSESSLTFTTTNNTLTIAYSGTSAVRASAEAIYEL